MSILQPWLPHARVLDLFAGSGALGLEALSRGANSAEFVDNDPRSLGVLRDNAAALGAAQRAIVTRADALRFVVPLDVHAYDIAFADPPYASNAAVHLAERWLQSPFAAIFSVEHRSGTVMPSGGDTRRYGDSSVTLYR